MESINLSMLNEPISNYISLVFVFTTFLTLLILLMAIKNAQPTSVGLIALGLILWLGVQGFLMKSGFFLEVSTKIPRFPVAIFPPFLLILVLFNTKSGKKFIDKLPLKHLTYLHTVRVLVEVVLFWLFLEKQVPELMTFEGRNFDIIAGITAPIIGFLYFNLQKINKKWLLIWNFVCLVLVINIVINAFLALPLAFQQQAFDQPNVGVLKFSIGWLPSFVVPVVIFCHLASIRRLLEK